MYFLDRCTHRQPCCKDYDLYTMVMRETHGNRFPGRHFETHSIPRHFARSPCFTKSKKQTQFTFFINVLRLIAHKLQTNALAFKRISPPPQMYKCTHPHHTPSHDFPHPSDPRARVYYPRDQQEKPCQGFLRRVGFLGGCCAALCL
jgi:hypothetical protein